MKQLLRKSAVLLLLISIVLGTVTCAQATAFEIPLPERPFQVEILEGILEKARVEAAMRLAEKEAAEQEVPEEVEEVEETLDRTKPIYEVYVDGIRIERATADIQWMIRDISTTYDLPEKAIYGLICAESGFIYDIEAQGCYGLCMIMKFWLTGAAVEHFTEDYKSRNLKDPYDNLLTLAEMMCYARETYDLDYTKREDIIKYLYFHNTGKDPRKVTRWYYSLRCLSIADELVTLQPEPQPE